MNKQLGAGFLLAGTAIGSGMISLPLVLAKFGILVSSILMLAFACLTYQTALIRAELNLHSNANATLGEVGAFFGCKRTGALGELALQALSFALMSAYIFGSSSILFSSIATKLPWLSLNTIIMLFACIILVIFLLCHTEKIIHVNKILFITMLGALIALMQILVWNTHITTMPNSIPIFRIQLDQWTIVMPIIFTSFGFQGSVHSVTKLCNNNRQMVRKACLLGSTITAIVYILWTATVLLVVTNNNTTFFQSMLSGKVREVGELVQVLSAASSAKAIRIAIWIVSFSSLLTSVLGVGLATIDMLQQRLTIPKWQNTAIVVLIPTLIAMLVPSAFVRMLNISGIILVIIAIIVPIIISHHMQKTSPHASRSTISMLLSLTCGIIIIVPDILDMLQACLKYLNN